MIYYNQAEYDNAAEDDDLYPVCGCEEDDEGDLPEWEEDMNAECRW